MHPQRRSLAWINVAGGVAVLGSYAHGLLTHPGSSDAVWGGVPASLRPVYSVSMLTAAAGYFAFTYFVFFRLDPEETRTFGGRGYGCFSALYVLILLFSALWMPLTYAMLETPGTAIWLAIRGVLAVVGLASLALVVALLRVEPRRPAWAHRLAVAGSIAFAWQTAVLDAVAWPAWFPV